MTRVTVPAAVTGRRSKTRVPRRLNPGRRTVTDCVRGPRLSVDVSAAYLLYAAAAFIDRTALHRTDRLPAARLWAAVRSRLPAASRPVYRTCRNEYVIRMHIHACSGILIPSIPALSAITARPFLWTAANLADRNWMVER